MFARSLLRKLPFAARTLSTESGAARPFRVLGVQQIAVGGLDKVSFAHVQRFVLIIII